MYQTDDLDMKMEKRNMEVFAVKQLLYCEVNIIIELIYIYHWHIAMPLV